MVAESRPKMNAMTREERDELEASARLRMVNGSAPRLCYIDAPWAYFTTQSLADQWGDDWDDAPYEHNAGAPYAYNSHDQKEGRAPWEIVKVAYDGEFETPSDPHHNSPWSVERINDGAVPWLRSSSWLGGDLIVIQAGATLDYFRMMIEKGGGAVYSLPNAVVSNTVENTKT